MLRSAILALGPGSRSARARALAALGRDTSVRSRGAQSEPLALSRFTMSNSAVLFVPAARVAAPGFVRLFRRCLHFCVRRRAHGALAPAAVATAAIPSPPMRGGWSADRRTLSFGRACDARPPCPGATGTSLGAPPWRFSDADPRSRLPAVEPEPQRLPAPGINARRAGSGPPVVAVRAAAWDATPRSAFQDRLRKTPLHERGWESLYYKFVT